MILLTFDTADGWALGVKTARGVVDVAAAREALGLADVPASPAAALASGSDGLPYLRELVDRAQERPELLREEADLRLGPCASTPGKIICVGLNYRCHAAESGMAEPTTPVLFSKFHNTIAGPGEAIPLPAGAVEYDYEVELAVVIGRRTKHVAATDALAAVLGYCTANDLSARDLQNRTSQWLLGKTSDKFMPLGPYLVTADEVPDPQALALRCWVNGEQRQDSNTADMIFPVAEIIAYTSRYLTLEPGDLILTGTPEGVILGMSEKVWLKAGDEVAVEVEGLGRLTNPLVAEERAG